MLHGGRGERGRRLILGGGDSTVLYRDCIGYSKSDTFPLLFCGAACVGGLST